MIDSLDFIDHSLTKYFEGISEFFNGSFQNTFLNIWSIFVRLIILIKSEHVFNKYNTPEPPENISRATCRWFVVNFWCFNTFYKQWIICSKGNLSQLRGRICPLFFHTTFRFYSRDSRKCIESSRVSRVKSRGRMEK